MTHVIATASASPGTDLPHVYVLRFLCGFQNFQSRVCFVKLSALAGWYQSSPPGILAVSIPSFTVKTLEVTRSKPASQPTVHTSQLFEVGKFLR